MDKSKANTVYKILAAKYPEVTTALEYKDTLQLLVATILSAQCTDKRVNIVTKKLFAKYRSVEDFAGADMPTFESEIRPTGFYKNKAKNIINAAIMVKKDYACKVPDTMAELVKLPGVARKTANIVLFHGFGKNEGIAVDTHVKRVSARIGFTYHSDPVKIEQDLMFVIPEKQWGIISNLLIKHGRERCSARKPLCGECELGEICEKNI